MYDGAGRAAGRGSWPASRRTGGGPADPARPARTGPKVASRQDARRVASRSRRCALAGRLSSLSTETVRSAPWGAPAPAGPHILPHPQCALAGNAPQDGLRKLARRAVDGVGASSASTGSRGCNGAHSDPPFPARPIPYPKARPLAGSACKSSPPIRPGHAGRKQTGPTNGRARPYSRSAAPRPLGPARIDVVTDRAAPADSGTRRARACAAARMRAPLQELGRGPSVSAAHATPATSLTFASPCTPAGHCITRRKQCIRTLAWGCSANRRAALESTDQSASRTSPSPVCGIRVSSRGVALARAPVVAASGDGTLAGAWEARWRPAGVAQRRVYAVRGPKGVPSAGAGRAVASPGAAAGGGPVKGKGKVEQAAAAEVRTPSGRAAAQRRGSPGPRACRRKRRLQSARTASRADSSRRQASRGGAVWCGRRTWWPVALAGRRSRISPGVATCLSVQTDRISINKFILIRQGPTGHGQLHALQADGEAAPHQHRTARTFHELQFSHTSDK